MKENKYKRIGYSIATALIIAAALSFLYFKQEKAWSDKVKIDFMPALHDATKPKEPVTIYNYSGQ